MKISENGPADPASGEAMAPGPAVRGLRPSRLERPASRQELGLLLRETHGAVVPVGGGTRLGLGGPLDAASYLAVDLTGLDRVVDYPAEDLTITVEPGLRIEALAHLLASRKQWLPIDPPFPAEATVGGLVATAASGPLRPFGETPRRHLIGISVMDGDGVVHRAGGRVVKNVAGYDMMKLHAGAMGSLGVIVEMSLRTRPLPETEVLLLGRSNELGAVERLAAALNRSDLEPATFLAYDSATALELHRGARFVSPLGIAVGFLGFREDVAWCTDEFARLARVHDIEIEHHLVDHAARDFRARLAWRPEADDIELRASTLPTRTFAVLRDVAGVFDAGRTEDPRGEHLASEPGGEASGSERPAVFVAYPSLGVVRVLIGRTTAVTADSIARARRSVLDHGGHLVIETCPDDLAGDIDVWGPGSGLELARHLKTALDPKRRFNPGRLAGGL